MDRRTWAFLGIGLVVTLVVAVFVSGFASDQPDGLERVAIDQGFEDQADDHALEGSPLADYSVEGIENEGLSNGVSGVIGVAITLAVTVALLYGTRGLRSRRQRRA